MVSGVLGAIFHQNPSWMTGQSVHERNSCNRQEPQLQINQRTSHKRHYVSFALTPYELWHQALAEVYAGNRTAPPEPEVQTLPEEAEEPSAAAFLQPKRQHKTTPKKTARKTSSEG
jgi:hypothetical protein